MHQTQHTSNRFLLGLLVMGALLLLPSASGDPSPVVGVFAYPNYENNNNTLKGNYIAASYTKWLEAGGVRSIPIPYDAESDLLDDIFGQINALFLPGGATALSDSIRYMLTKAVQSNQKGQYFPVWGTCLGFEFLVTFVGGTDAVDDGYNAENITLPLEQVQIQELYDDPYVFMTVQTKNVTMNNHERAVDPTKFQANHRLRSLWKITSTNVDRNGRAFVSTIEPIDATLFPFYGVQYHPEKNAFEYGTFVDTNEPYEVIDHSEDALRFSMYMARFFGNLARTSQQTDHQKHHQYTKPHMFPLANTYPMQLGVAFEQIHLIPNATTTGTNKTKISSSSKSSLRGAS